MSEIHPVSAVGAIAGVAQTLCANRDQQLVDMANKLPVYRYLCTCPPLVEIPLAVILVCSAYLGIKFPQCS